MEPACGMRISTISDSVSVSSHFFGGGVGDGEGSAVGSLAHDSLSAHSSGRRTSRVWKYFRMVDNCHYVCCLCSFVGAYTNTTNMRKHIQNHHPESFQDILDHTRPSNRLHFLRSFPPQLIQNSTNSCSQLQQNMLHPGTPSYHTSSHNDISGDGFSITNAGGCTPGQAIEITQPSSEEGDEMDMSSSPFLYVPPRNICPFPIKDLEPTKSPPQIKRSKTPFKHESKADTLNYYIGEDRKINVASMAPGNIVSSMDENSAGSGEAHHACDEVSVPLSPEQFLSEETERGTSPGTPSSQRPESYKLRHNNHLTLVLESLAGDESFMDVTLTAQGKAIKAHKSVLSAVSPYFRSVLKQNPCQHPIIIMPRDVRFEELSNIISYVYKGEMTVAAEDLSSLLKTAEVLQVTGLSPSDNNSGSSGIMSQMQGLPSGMFASTSTSSSSSTSKNSSRKSTKVMTHQTNEDTSQLSGSAETMGKIDPLEFLNADMTCVKEEIQSETEADLAEDSNISMSVEASDPISNTPEPMGSPSSSRRKSVGDPLRPGEGLTGKQFNPGDVSSCREESPTHSPSSTDPFVCPYCFETYRPSEVLHTHLRLKHPSKPSFPCSCGKVFIRQSLYTDHKKMCIF